MLFFEYFNIRPPTHNFNTITSISCGDSEGQKLIVIYGYLKYIIIVITVHIIIIIIILLLLLLLLQPWLSSMQPSYGKPP
jgi:hypothetical protein